MKRAQIYLEDQKYEALREAAFRRHASISSVLGELVDLYIVEKPKKARSPGGFLSDIVGIAHETKPDVAERHDDYLWGDAE